MLWQFNGENREGEKMGQIMMSSSPKECERIYNGSQTIIVKKTIPKKFVKDIDNFEPFKCYIYMTMGNLPKKITRIIDNKLVGKDIYEVCPNCMNGKVIGEFVCSKIINLNVAIQDMIEEYNSVVKDMECCGTCLTWKEINDYANGNNVFGYFITNLKSYAKPKELTEFALKKAPQSWGYVEEI